MRQFTHFKGVAEGRSGGHLGLPKGLGGAKWGECDGKQGSRCLPASAGKGEALRGEKEHKRSAGTEPPRGEEKVAQQDGGTPRGKRRLPVMESWGAWRACSLPCSCANPVCAVWAGSGGELDRYRLCLPALVLVRSAHEHACKFVHEHEREFEPCA
jgi:hypothetical protein